MFDSQVTAPIKNQTILHLAKQKGLDKAYIKKIRRAYEVEAVSNIKDHWQRFLAIYRQAPNDRFLEPIIGKLALDLAIRDGNYPVVEAMLSNEQIFRLIDQESYNSFVKALEYWYSDTRSAVYQPIIDLLLEIKFFRDKFEQRPEAKLYISV